MIRRLELSCTTDSSGAGTATSTLPVNGFVYEVRQNSAAWNFGGSVDYTFTRSAGEGGGTLLALTNKSGPFSAYLGGSVESGGPSSVIRGVPCEGNVTMIVAQGGNAIAGTVHVYYGD